MRFVIAYVVGLLLTFGIETARMEREHVLIPAYPGAIVAAVWPIYWPMRLSYLAFAD